MTLSSWSGGSHGSFLARHAMVVLKTLPFCDVEVSCYLLSGELSEPSRLWDAPCCDLALDAAADALPAEASGR